MIASNRGDFLQTRSPYETGIEKTQVLPLTQPISGEEIEGRSSLALPTQASALSGISGGVETQILKNMFDSLPPSSQIPESEMLGLSNPYLRT